MKKVSTNIGAKYESRIIGMVPAPLNDDGCRKELRDAVKGGIPTSPEPDQSDKNGVSTREVQP